MLWIPNLASWRTGEYGNEEVHNVEERVDKDENLS